MIANNIFCQILDQAKNAKPTKAITDLIDNQVLIIGDILNENVRTLVPLVQVAVSPAWRSRAISQQLPIGPMSEDIAAIIQGLHSVSPEKALRSLLVLWFVDHNNFLLDHILATDNIGRELQIATVKWASSLSCKLNARPGIPVYEQEAIMDFQHAIASCDYKGIDQFLTMLLRGSRRVECPVPQCLFRIWAHYDLHSLVVFLEKKVSTDFITLHIAVTALSLPSCMKIGLQTDNCLLCLHVLNLHFKTSAISSCPDTAKIISKLTKCSQTWTSFCAYFGEFPSRYPALWIEVGRGLKDADSVAMKTLIWHFAFGRFTPEHQEFFDIFNGLTDVTNSDEDFEWLFIFTETRWRCYFRNRRRMLDEMAAHLELSSYYDVMIASINNRRDMAWVKKHIKVLLNYLDVSMNRWFVSRVEFQTHMILFASQLLPYLEAYRNFKCVNNFDITFEEESISILEYNYNFRCHGVWSENTKFVEQARTIIGAPPTIIPASLKILPLLEYGNI